MNVSELQVFYYFFLENQETLIDSGWFHGSLYNKSSYKYVYD